jgi:beta-glucuronidase
MVESPFLPLIMLVSLHAIGQNMGARIETGCVKVRFGLRVVSRTPDGELRLNGRPLFLRGVNRHTAHPGSGPALTQSQLQRDVDLLKAAGVNFVRGAHYPQDQTFLDFCDEHGILVWEETCCPDFKAHHFSSSFVSSLLRGISAMTLTSANHPSVIIWGFLNEGASDRPEVCPAYTKAVQAFREREDGRLITWASNKYEGDVCIGDARPDVLSFNG